MSQALGIGFKENISFPKSEALASATQKFSSLVFFSLELRQQGVIAVSMKKDQYPCFSVDRSSVPLVYPWALSEGIPRSRGFLAVCGSSDLLRVLEYVLSLQASNKS